MTDNPYEAPTQPNSVAGEGKTPGVVAIVFIVVLTLVSTVVTFFVTCFVSGIALLSISDFGIYVAIVLGSIAALLVGVYIARGLWRGLSG